LKNDTCSGCGESKSDSFDGANEAAYEVHTLRCHACAARDARSKEIEEDDTADTGGLFLSVQKRPRKGR
jgi:hypothetical protein